MGLCAFELILSEIAELVMICVPLKMEMTNLSSNNHSLDTKKIWQYRNLERTDVVIQTYHLGLCTVLTSFLKVSLSSFVHI